jgi:predicted small lipoprotein YifL
MAAQAGKEQNLISPYPPVLLWSRPKECVLNRFGDRIIFRLALTAVLATSLGLAACGRKGPLDPPPGGTLTGEPQAGASAPATNSLATPPSKDDSPGIGPDGRARAPKGENKRIPLDSLLN